MSAREVSQLQKNLTELENGLTVSDSTQQLRTELTNLNNKVRVHFAHCVLLHRDHFREAYTYMYLRQY